MLSHIRLHACCLHMKLTMFCWYWVSFAQDHSEMFPFSLSLSRLVVGLWCHLVQHSIGQLLGAAAFFDFTLSARVTFFVFLCFMKLKSRFKFMMAWVNRHRYRIEGLCEFSCRMLTSTDNIFTTCTCGHVDGSVLTFGTVSDWVICKEKRVQSLLVLGFWPTVRTLSNFTRTWTVNSCSALLN